MASLSTYQRQAVLVAVALAVTGLTALRLFRTPQTTSAMPKGTKSGHTKKMKLAHPEPEPKEKTKKRIGIIGALPEEIAKLKSAMTDLKEVSHGKFFQFFVGELHDRPVVVARCGVGLCYASSVATIMIEKYNVDIMIFTGVGGGLKDDQEVGDIIIGEDCIHYELNCTQFKLPWKPEYEHKRGEVPFADGLREFKCCPELMKLAMAAHLGEKAPKRTKGRIVSGSEFVTVPRKKEMKKIWEEVGHPDVVEMEGAGVAQVCHAYDIPFLIVRALSDTMEGDANVDFNTFAKEVAEHCFPIVSHICKHHE